MEGSRSSQQAETGQEREGEAADDHLRCGIMLIGDAESSTREAHGGGVRLAAALHDGERRRR